MTNWQDYLVSKTAKKPSNNGHTIVGNLKILPKFKSPQLGNKRDILIYLPPSFKTGGGPFPVLYFHDGQNLFDAATSFAGEWQVDETMEALSRDGLEAIVVGIPNTGADRINEYSPYSQDDHGGGRGDQYLDFIIETLKPRIDADFPTLSGRENTGIIGSSMGALISLYAFFRHPGLFGMVGVMSPSFWFAHNAIYHFVKEAAYSPGRIYLDAGTREYGDGWLVERFKSRRYCASVRRMNRLLYKKGYHPRRDLLYVEDKYAKHEESAWARRLPQAIQFLLKK